MESKQVWYLSNRADELRAVRLDRNVVRRRLRGREEINFVERVALIFQRFERVLRVVFKQRAR